MEPLDLTDRLIAEHVGLAMGAAAIPLPVADLAAVTWVQVDLVHELARRYQVTSDRRRAREAVLALAGATLARAGASAVKALPGAGWWLGGATHAALAGATTWALGQVYREQFEAHGSLAAPDADVLRARYEACVERARNLARDLRERVSFDEAVDERAEDLERLARLRRAGVLREEEYRKLVGARGGSERVEPAEDALD
ncbi:MAG: DUF697 domain-containing protein [Myxococcota bacterium]